ncbi:MAG: hypothetical protein PUD93_08865 [Lachnospiraceae bacterium]|nr:hypothetical protein [Lachnospiraceae bacterium]
MFEERPTGEYNHMSVALDKNTGNRYVESFFHEQGNKYLNGQRVLPIKKFVLLDDKGNEFLSDTF